MDLRSQKSDLMSNMKLQQKLLFYFALPTIVLVAVIYSFIFVEINNNFLDLEKENALLNKERVESYLTEEATILYSTNLNWSQWDATFSYIENKNSHYLDNEILVEPFYDTKVNDLFIINLKGEILFTQNFDYTHKKRSPTESAIIEAVMSKMIMPLVFSKKKLTYFGLTQLGSRLYLYSIGAVTKSTGLGDPNGYMIFTKELDDNYLNKISNLLKTNIKILQSLSSMNSFTAIENQLVFDNTNSQVLKLNFPAVESLAIESRPFQFEISTIKSVSLQNRSSIKSIGLVAVASLLVAILLIYFFVHQDIIKKIIFLSQKLSTFHESERLKERLPISGNDEISTLAQEINHMLDELLKDQVRFSQTSRLSSLGEMAGSIAHEINNPMAIIHGNAYLIKSYVKTEPINADEIHNLAEKIENTTKRISKIVKSLRVVARDGENDPVDIIYVKDIVAEALNLCEAKLKNNKIFISVSSFNPQLKIQTRPVQIIQAMINLISNSQYAIEKYEGKWIRIDIVENKDNILIKVIDSGYGIESSIQEKIMQPFFTTKPVGQGTGLGLSISRSMIEANNGELYLDTQNKNTCFVIQIPKSQPMAEIKKIP